MARREYKGFRRARSIPVAPRQARDDRGRPLSIFSSRFVDQIPSPADFVTERQYRSALAHAAGYRSYDAWLNARKRAGVKAPFNVGQGMKKATEEDREFRAQILAYRRRGQQESRSERRRAKRYIEQTNKQIGHPSPSPSLRQQKLGNLDGFRTAMEAKYGRGRERLVEELRALQVRYRSRREALRVYVMNTPGEYATLQGFIRSHGESYEIPSLGNMTSVSVFQRQMAQGLGREEPPPYFSYDEHSMQVQHNTLWAKLEEAHIRATAAAAEFDADHAASLIIMVRSVPYVTREMERARRIAGEYPVGHPVREAVLRRITTYQAYLAGLRMTLLNEGALPADLQEDDGGLYYR